MAIRVQQRLGRTAADILAIGADLIQTKTLLPHGQFGLWLQREFGLSSRSAQMFMAAHRRFGDKGKAVSLLPPGAVLELSSPSVSDELVEQVLSGGVPPSVSAIREARAGSRTDHRSYQVAASFLDHVLQARMTWDDFSVGVTAHVLRRWKDPSQREWFATAMCAAAELLADNLETKIPMFELERTTVGRLKEHRSDHR